MKNLRFRILKALLRVESGSYSNLLLDSELKKIDDVRDKNLFTEIFYGVIRNKLYLDYIIEQFSRTPLAKMDKEVFTNLGIDDPVRKRENETPGPGVRILENKNKNQSPTR